MLCLLPEIQRKKGWWDDRLGVCCRGILAFRWTLSWPLHIKSVWPDDSLWISNLVLGNHSLCSKVGRMESSDVDLSKREKQVFVELAIPLVTWAARPHTHHFRHEVIIWQGQKEVSYPSSAALNCRIWFPCSEILGVVRSRTPGLWPTTRASAGESLLLQGASWVAVS